VWLLREAKCLSVPCLFDCQVNETCTSSCQAHNSAVVSTSFFIPDLTSSISLQCTWHNFSPLHILYFPTCNISSTTFPPHNIIHFLSFISSTTTPYTTSFIYILYNSPPHNIHFLWFISSITLFISFTTAPYTTSHIYFLHSSPLHNITYLFPPQQPPTQHHLFPVIYFPPQHYSQHHLHKLFISLRSIIYILHVIFFPAQHHLFPYN